MNKIEEKELPYPKEEENKKEEYAEILKDKQEPTKTIEVGDYVIFDFDCNINSKYKLNGIAIYNKKDETYKNYEDIRHYDVDKENKIVYILDREYNTQKIQL